MKRSNPGRKLALILVVLFALVFYTLSPVLCGRLGIVGFDRPWWYVLPDWRGFYVGGWEERGGEKPREAVRTTPQADGRPPGENAR